MYLLCVKIFKSGPVLCDPMDCSLPGSVHEILQARILEWVATPFSRGSSWPRIEPTSLRCPALAGRFLTTGETWETLFLTSVQFSSVAQSCPTLCDPMNCSMPGLPGVHSNSHPSSRWCHPASSSTVVPFSSCPQSLPVISFICGILKNDTNELVFKTEIDSCV